MKNDIFKTLSASDKEKTTFLSNNAIGLCKAGKLAEAIDVYRKVLDINPNYYNALNNIGCLLNAIGDPAQGLLYLNKAIELKKNKITAYYNCGNTYINLRQYEDAKKMFLKVLDINPNDASTLNNLGNIYSEFKNYEKALYYYDLAITCVPDSYLSYYNRGATYKDQAKYELAIESFTKAIQLNRMYIDAYESRCWCYEQIGQYDNAVEGYHIVSLIRNNGTKKLWYLLERARIAYKREFYYQALENYQTVARIRYPEHDPAELVAFIEPNQYDKWADACERIIAAGFFPVEYGNIQKYIFIFPHTEDRIVLKPEEIHIGKTYRKHLGKTGNRYELSFDSDFNAVMDRLDFYYKDEGRENYMALCRNVYPLLNQFTKSIKYISVELYLDGKLAAGELGILAGKVYISLTGFHDAPYAGTVQLILLARELVKKGVVILDLGPSTYDWDLYKLRLGAKKMTTEDYLKLFHESKIKNGEEDVSSAERHLFFPGCKTDGTVLKKANDKIESIIIPYGVTSIGDRAYYRCHNLLEVYIPPSVISIGNQAFLGCDKLYRVHISNSVTSIGEGAFFRCLKLIDITLHDNVTFIGEGAFDFCLELKIITIPPKVTSIGDEVFYGCASLEKITIPAGISSIGRNAFSLCERLTSVTFEGMIASDQISHLSFHGDLREKYLAGGAGTYITTAPVSIISVWEKQP
jgi:tetratricopeptide (TPR) repeat protein